MYITGGDGDNGLQSVSVVGVHNAAVQTSLIQPPSVRPQHYPHQVVPRPQYYRSPRTPLIRPDGTPGYLMPRIPSNGPLHSIANVQSNNAAQDGSSTPVSYAISQGTMTSPVIQMAGDGPSVSAPPETPLLQQSPLISRPNSLDIQQVQSAGVQTIAIVTTSASTGGVGGGMLDSSNNNNTGSKLLNALQVPGILNIAPSLIGNSNGPGGGSESVVLTTTTLTTTTVSSCFASVFQTTTTSTVMSYGGSPPTPPLPPVMSTTTVVCAPPCSVPQPPAAPTIGGSFTPSTQSSPNPTPGAMPIVPPHVHIPPPNVAPPLVTNLQQQHAAGVVPQPGELCDSPGSDSSGSGGSNGGGALLHGSTLLPQAVPPTPANSTNNTTTATFPQHSYPLWHGHQQQFFSIVGPIPSGAHAGSNGLVSPFGATQLHSYNIPPPPLTPTHHHPANGLSPEQLMLQNHLMNQALVAQHQQTHFWPVQTHQHYANYMTAHHHITRGNNGGKTGGKLISCYNCGKLGHRASECVEPSMETLNQGEM